MVDRPYQARRKRRPPRFAAGPCSAELDRIASAQISGLPAAGWCGSRAGAARRSAPLRRASRHLRWLMAGCGAFSHPAMKANATHGASHSACKARSIFLAMVDRSDQARQNAGPRISIKRLRAGAPNSVASLAVRFPSRFARRRPVMLALIWLLSSRGRTTPLASRACRRDNSSPIGEAAG